MAHTPPDLLNPDDPVVVEALTRPCDICGALKRTMCVKRPGIQADLAGRLIHLGRMQPANPPRKRRG